jgi:hypothetical protein
MKHSPGPWFIHPTEEPTAIMSGDLYVATCHFVPGWDGGHVPNANLIAAAPELLEALEELFDACPIEQFSQLDKARAAIAKAKGKA